MVPKPIHRPFKILGKRPPSLRRGLGAGDSSRPPGGIVKPAQSLVLGADMPSNFSFRSLFCITNTAPKRSNYLDLNHHQEGGGLLRES